MVKQYPDNRTVNNNHTDHISPNDKPNNPSYPNNPNFSNKSNKSYNVEYSKNRDETN